MGEDLIGYYTIHLLNAVPVYLHVSVIKVCVSVTGACMCVYFIVYVHACCVCMSVRLRVRL